MSTQTWKNLLSCSAVTTPGRPTPSHSEKPTSQDSEPSVGERLQQGRSGDPWPGPGHLGEMCRVIQQLMPAPALSLATQSCSPGSAATRPAGAASGPYVEAQRSPGYLVCSMIREPC